MDEPGDFFQNFTINLIMSAIFLEILSTIIQMLRVVKELVLDFRLTRRLKKVKVDQENYIEIQNM